MSSLLLKDRHYILQTDVDKSSVVTRCMLYWFTPKANVDQFIVNF